MEPGRLFQKCIDFRERYQIERLVADVENASMLDLLYHFNKDMQGGRGLNLYDASFPGDFQYQVSLIRACVQPQDKTLHFGDCSLLRDYLLEANVDDISKARPEDYPAIFAVGFVISYIKAHPKDPIWDKIKQVPKEEDYNPLTFGLGGPEI